MSTRATTAPLPRARPGAVVRLALSAALCGALTWLLVVAEERLPGQTFQASRLGQWLVHNPPDAVAARLAWASCVLLGVYLVTLHVVALIALLCRSAPLLGGVDRASGGLFRRLGAGAVAAGLCGTVVAGGPAGAQATQGHHSPGTISGHTGRYLAFGYPMAGPDMTLLGQPTDNGPPPMRLVTISTSASTSTAAPAASTTDPTTTAPAVGTVAADQAPLTAAARPLMRLVESPAQPPAAVPAVPAAPAEGDHHTSWVVRPGDNLWDIAAALQAAAGVQDEDLVRSYWLELIDANRDRLSDPDNPDLVFVGQQLRLPTSDRSDG